MRGILLLPWATGLVIVGLRWRWMAHPDFGAIGNLLATFGITEARSSGSATPTFPSR